MVRPEGFEPSASPSGGVRSIQLSYGRSSSVSAAYTRDKSLPRLALIVIFLSSAQLLASSTKFYTASVQNLTWQIKKIMLILVLFRIKVKNSITGASTNKWILAEKNQM